MKKEILNINEFKALINKYKTITDIDIDKWFGILGNKFIMNNLTGFGSVATCKLCKVLPKDSNCYGCVYFEINSAPYACTIHDSYKAILNAKSVAELLKAIRGRVLYMETILKEVELNLLS